MVVPFGCGCVVWREPARRRLRSSAVANEQSSDAKLAEEIERLVEYLNDLLTQAAGRGTHVAVHVAHHRARGEVAEMPKISVTVSGPMEP
jgi:hypothetical protein